MFTAILLGVSLSLDCAAILLSLHTIDHRQKSIIHFILPTIFAIFHTVMPLVGWIIGLGLKQFISHYDHWIAFVLLATLGFKIVYTSITNNNQPNQIQKLVDLKSGILLAFATSMDAIIIGMTFAFLKQPIFSNAIIIGLTTLIISLVADISGDHIGKIVKGNRAGLLAGIILIGLGIKILLEHLFS